jgi:hypothetical protein
MLASPDKYKGRWVTSCASRTCRSPAPHSAIDLAGDDLTISQVQDAYARVQGFRPWKAYLPSVAVLALPFDFKRMLQVRKVLAWRLRRLTRQTVVLLDRLLRRHRRPQARVPGDAHVRRVAAAGGLMHPRAQCTAYTR